MVKRIRVGVLCGGIGDEFEASIKTGADIIRALSDLPAVSSAQLMQAGKKYQPVDLLITKNGEWHINGVMATPKNLKKSVDVVFNALHGDIGENGEILNVLNELKIPFTGSRALASNISYNKILSKKVFKSLELKTPIHEVVENFAKEIPDIAEKNYFQEIAEKVFQKIPPPWIIKPVRGGSSYNTHYADNLYDLYEALLKVAETPRDIFIEQFIDGREVVVGVIDNFREENHYTLIPHEIKHGGKILDCEIRKSGEYKILNLARYENDKKDELTEMAKKIHHEMGLEHYSTTDFIISPAGIYVLETDNLPHLHQDSVFAKSLDSVGINMGEFLDHIITLALKRK